MVCECGAQNKISRSMWVKCGISNQKMTFRHFFERRFQRQTFTFRWFYDRRNGVLQHFSAFKHEAFIQPSRKWRFHWFDQEKLRIFVSRWLRCAVWPPWRKAVRGPDRQWLQDKPVGWWLVLGLYQHHIYIYVYMYICIYVYMYICMYIYILVMITIHEQEIPIFPIIILFTHRGSSTCGCILAGIRGFPNHGFLTMLFDSMIDRISRIVLVEWQHYSFYINSSRDDHHWASQWPGWVRAESFSMKLRIWWCIYIYIYLNRKCTYMHIHGLVRIYIYIHITLHYITSHHITYIHPCMHAYMHRYIDIHRHT